MKGLTGVAHFQAARGFAADRHRETGVAGFPAGWSIFENQVRFRREIVTLRLHGTPGPPARFQMDWFGWQLPKDRAHRHAPFGPKTLLQDLDTRVPRYLDDVDQGRLVYPACKRASSDAAGEIGSIWDHTRLEAMRYVMAVPARAFELMAEPARQGEMLEAYLRQRPHEDTVIEFTGITMSDIAIAVFAGLAWLNHCATLVEVKREKFLGTLSTFRKVAVLAQKWWATEGAETRCHQMVGEHQTPPLMLYLVWLEYTRLAKEIASAARSQSPVDRAAFEAARDPGELAG
jgi:hypothetical protein